mgnify:CR=1 FL=1
MNYMISISDKNILLLFDTVLLERWESHFLFHLDYLIICDESLPDPKKLKSMFTFDSLIVSSSVKSYYHYDNISFSNEATMIDVRRNGACLLFSDALSNKKKLKALGNF